MYIIPTFSEIEPAIKHSLQDIEDKKKENKTELVEKYLPLLEVIMANICKEIANALRPEKYWVTYTFSSKDRPELKDQSYQNLRLIFNDLVDFLKEKGWNRIDVAIVPNKNDYQIDFSVYLPNTIQ